MSYVLYLHPAVCGTPNWHKSGKAITPYSAVRLRQRNMYKQFSIPHLWFGNPNHISYLETRVQEHFDNPDNGLTNQELVHGTEQEIVEFIHKLIVDHKLEVAKLKLTEPYTATRSGQCPFGFPTERNIHLWALAEIQRLFYNGSKKQLTKSPKNTFSYLFE